jgi:N6-adenosine-specific RNA methylase IME4
MKYKTIVIDPPWKYGSWGKSKASHRPNDFTRPMPYSTMTLDEIKNLPVKMLADDNCELYLWTTQKYLAEAIGILKAWGFKHCTTITWCKKPMGTGQGGVYCPTTEFLLHGRIGKMPKVKRIDSTWFLTKREHNAHSRKPEFFQDMIEAVSVAPRLEMFARRKRVGWDVWGNEVESDIQIINDHPNGFEKAEGSVGKKLLKPDMSLKNDIQAKLL